MVVDVAPARVLIAVTTETGIVSQLVLLSFEFDLFDATLHAPILARLFDGGRIWITPELGASFAEIRRTRVGTRQISTALVTVAVNLPDSISPTHGELAFDSSYRPAFSKKMGNISG